MPTFSSSSVHLSKLVTRRPRTSTLSSATSIEPEKAADQSDGVMKRQQDPKKAISSNGYAVVKKVVKYRECRKNHAASVGGHAVDGCLEFMASGEEGTTAALKCAACCCHRSFHKREVERVVLCDCSSNSASPR